MRICDPGSWRGNAGWERGCGGAGKCVTCGLLREVVWDFRGLNEKSYEY